MHGIIGNSDLLNFELTGVYDYPFSPYIGKTTKETIYGIEKKDLLIESYKNINWSDNFDTLILEHTYTLDTMFKMNFKDYFEKKAKKYNKQIYYLDNVKVEENDNSFSPYLNTTNFTLNSSGMLHKILVPVIAIVGTSPEQGKFNTQLELRREFIKIIIM
ncbi:hypothetical protein [Nosocomiicoccus ampullae]|uniref:Uncharacterized protein n=1 Tax=Nosocomiicoccus ampullae TaxID=489910 RepID=A0A9Q2CXD5_9STAP|nr:hypothetical protein [Nosocomiicoccus ampullae]MBB5175190.1 hypothetical protein [Nosocomiicoccus ampullae]QYA46431.1 hypothetical protein KPF49_05355 [Nosocomiicoccus ampullae]